MEIDIAKVEAHLEHVGVKGMKWGIRKREKAEPIPDGEYRVTAKPGQKVQVEGGRGLTPHEDAVRVAAAREAAKNSTTDSLSTKQLQELVTRTQLEQQYSKLTTPQNQNQMKNGLKKVKEIMEIKKTVDQITQDPFIKEQMETISRDFGLDKLIRKGAETLVNKRYK